MSNNNLLKNSNGTSSLYLESVISDILKYISYFPINIFSFKSIGHYRKEKKKLQWHVAFIYSLNIIQVGKEKKNNLFAQEICYWDEI